MPSKLGTPIPRQRSGHVYLFIAVGVAAVSAIGAFRGSYGWGLSVWAFGMAALLYLLPWLTPRRQENVQVDDTGVIVLTEKGQDEVRWGECTRVRIITTSAGPWSEDVFFVLDGSDGTGCIVPHDAATRTKLLQEMQVRLRRIDDRKIVEAMGTTSTATFTIWEKPPGFQGELARP